MAQLQPQISWSKTQKSEGNQNEETKKKLIANNPLTTKNISDDAKIKTYFSNPYQQICQNLSQFR